MRRNAKELLVLTGEAPEVNSEVAARLADYGHADFISYVVWACERALERGLLPHTNLGVLDRADLVRLREVTASQGLMLESISERLMETVHAGSPTKHPARRLETIEAAGELRIPFTSGILVGIGETEDERVASLEALAAVNERHGHLQEVILQNYVPHPRYYGREVAEIADEAATERWANREPSPSPRTPAGEAEEVAGIDSEPLPAWATPVTLDDMKRLVAECRRLMPEVGIQIPPNLSDWWLDLVEAGATDLGGLSANGDHISPEQAFPSPHQVRKRLSPQGYALTERLCAYPQYLEPEWMEQGVLDVVKLKYWSFIPRKGSGRRSERTVDPDPAPRAIERGRAGEALTEDELTALFAETRPEVIERDARRRRRAARGARRRYRDLRRQPQRQLHQRLRRRLRLLRLRAGQALARRLPRQRRGLPGPDRRGGRLRRRPRSACRAGSIPTTRSSTTARWLRLAKEVAPQHPPARLLADGGPLHVRALGQVAPTAVFDYLLECGLGSTPGHGRRGARRRRPDADLAQQAARRRAGSRSSRPATAPACARPRP